MTQSVDVIGITNPTIMDGSGKRISASEYLSYVARISNPQNEKNFETSGGLIKYLIKEDHWSPFEMINIVMEIRTTRDIARQILRHRSFSFQEFSQRYANPTELGFHTREARLQDPKNRQSSIETDDDNLAREWEQYQLAVEKAALISYDWALENGIAKEQARVVLPEGMMGSRLYMNGTLRSWLHFIELRIGNGTQKEHREIAAGIRDLIADEIPAVQEWLNEL